MGYLRIERRQLERFSDLACIILRESYFDIATDTYHQKLGTAIGAKFVPPYGNLFMAGLGKKIFSDAKTNPLLWIRYLDDVFCICTYGLHKLTEVLIYLSFSHPTIKYSMNYSSTNIIFLNVSITKNGAKLSTDLFTKDTDFHQYLHVTTCHSPYCKKSIPYGQVIWFKWIRSYPNKLNTTLNKFSDWLVNRRCKQEVVMQEIHWVDTAERKSLLLKYPKQNKVETLTLALTCQPSLKMFMKYLPKHIVILMFY